MPGVTLDAGGLIALDRNDRRVVILLARARETGARVTVPATALLTVRAPSGRTAAFAAHGQCIIGVFHPTARTLLDAAPIIAEPD